ncbi:hypothetical protein [Mesorhizobium kowhaii]|uniref:Uncharacterized protein n=1 Tax=Mesorhizobium kowhaii TaxID=1300272 RepID=A0A2W7CK24_9HYPH|nr:hypothetical protein [Mesorhizobium kowhaii]PZV36903.1 hypothetical protein B5V02_19575 [Mesorhizobium kowhaii]
MSPFTFQQVANYGTSEPIVARLTSQASALRFSATDDEEEVFGEIWRCQQALMECHQARLRVQASVTAGQEKAIADRGKGINAIPYAIGLETDAQAFLLSAKQYLHSVAGLILRLFKTTAFKPDAGSLWTKIEGGKTKVAQAVVWAESTLGKDAGITNLLTFADAHVGEVIKWRNAAEHSNDPNSKSGNLEIKNFTIEHGRVLAPRWRRTIVVTEAFVDVEEKLVGWENFLLDFGERVILEGYQSRLPPMMTIALIPQAEIDPANPYRYRLALRGK